MAQLQAQLKRQSVERDSLDLDRGDDNASSNDKQLSNYQTQLAISLGQFRRQLRSLCTLCGDRAVHSAWSATLDTIGYVLDNRLVFIFFQKNIN